MKEYTRLTVDQGYHVHAWMRTLFGLKGIDLSIFAIVYSYAQTGDGVGGTQFFSEWTGASKPTILRSIQALEADGLIESGERVNGQRANYSLGQVAIRKLEEAGIDAEAVSKFYRYQNFTGKKMIPDQYQNFTGTGKKMIPATKLERTRNNQNNKEKEMYKEKELPEEKMPDIVERAMQPHGGHEVPTMQEVVTALRNLTVRPMESQLETCAGYFLDKMDREQWRTRDWRGALTRYAARWVARDNTGQASRANSRQVPYCKPGDTYKDPGECPW